MEFECKAMDVFEKKLAYLIEILECLHALNAVSPSTILTFSFRKKMFALANKHIENNFNVFLGKLINAGLDKSISNTQEELALTKKKMKQFTDAISLFVNNPNLSLKTSQMRKILSEKFPDATAYYLHQIRNEVIKRTQREATLPPKFIDPDSADGKRITGMLVSKFVRKTQNGLSIAAVKSATIAMGFNLSDYNVEVFYTKIKIDVPQSIRLMSTLSSLEMEFLNSIADSFKIKNTRAVSLIVRSLIYMMAQGSVNVTELLTIAKNMEDDEAKVLIKIINQVDLSGA
jgi:hypothetical protein